MKRHSGIITDDVRSIMFSDEYWKLLKKIGFSKTFILNEKIRKQKECIDFLLSQLETISSPK